MASPTERPIPFSAPMIRAIRDGRKTQTRRFVKPQPDTSMLSPPWRVEATGSHGWGFMQRIDSPADEYFNGHFKSRWGVGDHLWVRETWQTLQKWDHIAPRHIMDDTDKVRYAADEYQRNPLWAWGRRRSSIHMPRWASRIALRVTDVRCERLQEITETDASAEGVEPPTAEREDHDWSICPQCGGTRLYNGIGQNLGVLLDCDCSECDTHAKRFRHIWNHINGANSWEANPFVWAITFERIK